MSDAQDDEGRFTSTVGPINIDWPRTLGYYGAIAVAVGFEVIAPPLGIFIAAVPLFKLLKRKHASSVERFIASIVEGAGKPVGGDAEGVVRPKWIDDEKAKAESKERASERGNAASPPPTDATEVLFP